MYFRSALLMADLVLLKRITWITSSKRWLILPVMLKWKCWLLLLCLNCSQIRYWSIFYTKKLSLRMRSQFIFFFFFSGAEMPVPFLLHVLPFNFYFSAVFFLFTGRISLLYPPSLIFALSFGTYRANEHSALCISLILNPDHSKSVLCSQGLCSATGFFCLGCFIAPGMTCAIWQISLPLHSDHLLLALKSKWKFVSIPNLLVVP